MQVERVTLTVSELDGTCRVHRDTVDQGPQDDPPIEEVDEGSPFHVERPRRQERHRCAEVVHDVRQFSVVHAHDCRTLVATCDLNRLRLDGHRPGARRREDGDRSHPQLERPGDGESFPRRCKFGELVTKELLGVDGNDVVVGTSAKIEAHHLLNVSFGGSSDQHT